MLKGYKLYETQWNGGFPFKVYVKNNNLIVEDNREGTKNYRKNILDIDFEKIYIGKAPILKKNRLERTYGKIYDGNTILVKLKDNQYLFISAEIYKFELNDDLIKYLSPVVRSIIPEAVIIGKENIYLLNEKKYISKKYFEKMSKNQIVNDVYEMYYGKPIIEKDGSWTKREKGLKNVSKKLKKMKKIVKMHSYL
jgi:hypothetical protein